MVYLCSPVQIVSGWADYVSLYKVSVLGTAKR